MRAPGELVVLVVAPLGRDAQLITNMLSNGGMLSQACSSIEDLCRKMETGVGAVVVTEEAFVPGALDHLLKVLDAQPKWSDIELIILTSNGNRAQATVKKALKSQGLRSMVVLERPMRMLTFAGTVAAALNSRRRQYEMRHYMEERARQEERLRQTQKLESLGVLAGGIAHDFNNLLTGVLGNASLALDVIPAGSSLAPLLTNVVQASERAANLTRQLLAYAGKGRFFIQRLDLSQQVREISSLIQLSIPRTVQVRLELAPDLALIEGDAAQIQQVIMNLVINAAEAIPEGHVGTVLITTGMQDIDAAYIQSIFGDADLAPGNHVCLEVHDTGTGMDTTTLGRIFDPFFTTKFTGRGLGLAAVLGIVRGHKGGVKVYSEPGQGTTFKILFPATADKQIDRAEAEGVRAASSGTGTVLVIDDEEIVRRTARATLERFGYSVLEAENGELGVSLFRERSRDIAVVLLDMTMPVMSGEEAFRHLRSIRQDVKVILSSGYNEVEAVRRFTGKGLAGFLQKPYTGTKLAEKIRSIL
jgi:signal transduction histidine kinase